MKTIYISLATVTVFCLSACGKKLKQGDSSNVKVEFAMKATSLSMGQNLLGATEGYVAGADLKTLKIKPIAVRISENNNGGYMIWGSKNCKGEESKKEIDDKEFTYVSEHVCTSNEGDDYLDMLDTAALNNTLNSQTWPTPPGTYKYVSLIMCTLVETGSPKNLSYRGPKMTADHEVRHCDPFTGYSESGIVVPEGGSLTVKLTYDLDKLIGDLTHTEDMTKFTPGPGTYNCYWTDDGLTQYCPNFGVDALVPSISN